MSRVSRAIAEIVQRQADTGLDVINDGEHSKVSWMAYARGRLSGLEEIDSPVRFRGATRDSLAFPAAYEDMKIDAGGKVVGHCRKAHRAPQGVDLQRPDRLCRPERTTRRYRQPQSRTQGRESRGGFCHRNIAVELGALLRKSLLRFGGGVSHRIGRRHARRVQSHCRCRICAADRRSADGDALQSHAGRVHRRLPKIHGVARGDRQSRPARDSARTAFAFIPATASISRRAYSTSN